jgi:hypothetical protein
MRIVVLALALLAMPAFSQKFEFWPGAQYDASIPSPEKVLGYPTGQKHTTHADIVRYFEALAAAAPSRIKVFEYGTTWEGRKLIYAVVGSESNIARIEQIKAGAGQLADPGKTGDAAAAKLISSLPAVIDLSYGVHGNEISSPDAAMLTAYHLVAARNDKLTADVRQNVVVLIDPLQNPDGRDRFIQNYRASAGLEPDPSPVSAERAEPWPGGRSNHYLFDMNRDWFALTQPETRGRIAYLKQWMPLIFVDLHEMGTDSTYFFSPGAEPYNPHLTKQQKDYGLLFGKNNAKWFDQFGFTYFTREVFDEFYPGYGASWPWLYGGMGMTYENASVRGIVARKSDESLYTFQESVQKHFVASIATCETAAANRELLLKNFWAYGKTAIEEGSKEAVKEYILPLRGDASAVDKLAHLLSEQGIVVRRAEAAFSNAGKQYPAGSYVISAAQQRKRMIRTLLDPQSEMDPAFVKEQERRRKKNLRDEIYDVTAWSLPMLYNVECVQASEASSGNFAAISGAYQPKGAAPARATVAYLVPWGSQAAGRFLTAALRAGLRVTSAGKPFKQNGRQFPAGTLVAGVKQNDSTVHDKVARIAAASGAEVVAANSSWVDEGINFGSNNAQFLKKPAIAMLWDSPASSLAAGATRFVIERMYGYPVTVIRPQALAMADLSRFHVLILPDNGGNYASALGPSTDRIKNWVRSGGTLIGIGGALDYLSSQQVGLLALQEEALAIAEPPQARPADAAKPTPAAKPPASAASSAAPGAAQPPAGPVPGKILNSEEDYQKAIKGDREMPDAVAGVLLRAKPDHEHWIAHGLPETIHVLYDGRTIYAPLKKDKGVNPILFAGPDQILAAGVLWEENRKQLAFKPFVVVQGEGRGTVIGFTADPNFRAYMDGLNVVFLNALFRSPSAAGRGGAMEANE